MPTWGEDLDEEGEMTGEMDERDKMVGTVGAKSDAVGCFGLEFTRGIAPSIWRCFCRKDPEPFLRNAILGGSEGLLNSIDRLASSANFTPLLFEAACGGGAGLSCCKAALSARGS